MIDYKIIQEEMLYTASLNAKKEIKEIDEYSDIISDYLYNENYSKEEKEEVVSTMIERIYSTSEEIKKHLNGMIYIHDLIVDDYKEEVERLRKENKELMEVK